MLNGLHVAFARKAEASWCQQTPLFTRIYPYFLVVSSTLSLGINGGSLEICTPPHGCPWRKRVPDSTAKIQVYHVPAGLFIPNFVHYRRIRGNLSDGQ